MTEVVSLRLPTDLVNRLNTYASQRGLNRSDLIRALIANHIPAAHGWTCDHITMTAGVPLTNVRTPCGCQMRPTHLDGTPSVAA